MPSTPSRSPAAALRDIVENIELARSFVDGLSFDVSSGPPDALRGRTVLEIISEASRRLPADLKARHPEIPWTDVAAQEAFIAINIRTSAQPSFGRRSNKAWDRCEWQ
jgi:uncharacterized protein with HEPN domain